MTNREIQRQATRFAEHLAAQAEFLDPEAAWYRWSLQHCVSGPAARHLFEQMYETRMACLTRCALRQAWG